MFLKNPLILSSLLIVAIPFSNGLCQNLIDKKATKKTKALYENLKRISEQGFLFGHQDDDAYGIGWSEVEGNSDVKSVTGSYPAVHGWDLGKIELSRKANLDNVNFEKMHNWIKQTYKRGGINTISWHVDNPVT